MRRRTGCRRWLERFLPCASPLAKLPLSIPVLLTVLGTLAATLLALRGLPTPHELQTAGILAVALVPTPRLKLLAAALAQTAPPSLPGGLTTTGGLTTVGGMLNLSHGSCLPHGPARVVLETTRATLFPEAGLGPTIDQRSSPPRYRSLRKFASNSFFASAPDGEEYGEGDGS